MIRRLACAGLVTAAFAPTARAQARELNTEEVLAWKRIRNVATARDGSWFAYVLTPHEGNGRTVFRRVSDGTEHGFNSGNVPGTALYFSHDSRWAVFDAAPQLAEPGASPGFRADTEPSVVLLNLESGSTQSFTRSQRHTFGGASSRWFAVHMRRAGDAAGSELLLLDLSSDVTHRIANVSEFRFDDAGARLFYMTDAPGGRNSAVVMRDLTTWAERTLESGAATLRHLTLSGVDNGTLLAMRVETGTALRDTTTSFVLVSNVLKGTPRKVVFSPASDKAFAQKMSVNVDEPPRLTSDAEGIYFSARYGGANGEAAAAGVNEQRSVSDSTTLLLWHYMDARLQPQRRIEAARASGSGMLMLYWTGQKKLLQLGDTTFDAVTVAPRDRWALATAGRDYELESNLSGRTIQDVYAIDLRTGEKRLAMQRLPGRAVFSPDGQRFHFFSDGHYYVYEMSNGVSRNITQGLPVSFVNTESDYADPKPPRPVLGWAADSRSVLISDGWDVWNIPVNGRGAANLTLRGRTDSMRFRGPIYTAPRDSGVDLRKPVYFYAYGEWTKKEGLVRLEPGRIGARMLLLDDSDITMFRAPDADVFFYTKQTVRTFPDYYSTDTSFNRWNRLTNANPQQGEIPWSAGAKLVDYTTEKGKRLQGALYLPSNYVEGTKYPTVVQIYERQSQQLHWYSSPSFEDALNTAIYTSRGYAVFKPDIAYEVNDPGLSAVWSVVPAVEAAIATGVVDRERIGLHGHSWGAYEAAFLITQSRLFRAASVAAPVSDLVSMYGSVYWETGAMNASLFETGQGRMSGGVWEQRDAFIRNSPIFHVSAVETPLLIMHNDGDRVVEFSQGVQLYSALRKLGKPVVLLQYEGEGHELFKPVNQRDYAQKLMQHFDYHLKGGVKPSWW